MKIHVVLLLAVVNFIHCDECKLMFDLAIVEIGGSLRTIYNHLKGHDQLLQRIPDMQEKLEHLENNLQDMQEKLEHLENNLQGLSRETAQCLKGEDLEHLTNVSAAANQEIKSFHEEMSEVIAWSQKDECLEGGLPCGDIGTCENTLFSFTCSCPSGFTWDGSECKEFQCRSPAERFPGVGCLMLTGQHLTFEASKKTCEEEGMRLVQHMSLQQLQDMGRSFIYFRGWVGVYDGKWMSDGSLVPEDLWLEGYRSDPSRRCGIIDLDSSSSSYKLDQKDCSEKRWGLCQFPMP
ncbi:uncharacterized protein [Palaemon carinicauda]|uniref:uncharacterized protein isoform X2 n=1 Tax=Palaemon carinicauda TaxID=392227 RepID=UPI0035B57740